MALIDRRADHLSYLDDRLRQANTFSETLCLLNDRHQLVGELQKGIDEVNRIARGWVFIPPS
jgi:nitric oxide reductase activation protein